LGSDQFREKIDLHQELKVNARSISHTLELVNISLRGIRGVPVVLKGKESGQKFSLTEVHEIRDPLKIDREVVMEELNVVSSLVNKVFKVHGKLSLELGLHECTISITNIIPRTLEDENVEIGVVNRGLDSISFSVGDTVNELRGVINNGLVIDGTTTIRVGVGQGQKGSGKSQEE